MPGPPPTAGWTRSGWTAMPTSGRVPCPAGRPPAPPLPRPSPPTPGCRCRTAGGGRHRHPPAGSRRTSWPVTVATLEQHAHTIRVRLDGTPPVLADITPAVVAELRLAPGTPLHATVKATETTTYPA